MAHVPMTVSITEDKNVILGLSDGEVGLMFTRVFDEKSSETNVIRVTPDELEATRDAIDNYFVAKSSCAGLAET